MNKKIALTAITFLVAGAGLLGVTSVSAEDLNDSQTTIVEKIATKFGVKKEDVQAVFDEERATRHAEMEKNNVERLAKLVADGKITEDQKKLILEKHTEMEKDREANLAEFKNLSPEDRKVKIQTMRAEVKAWATENGIDMQYLHGFGGKGHGMGKFRGMGH